MPMTPIGQIKQKFYESAAPTFSKLDWGLTPQHTEITPSNKTWCSDFIATCGSKRMAIFFIDLKEGEDLFSDENIRLREEQYSLVAESMVRGLWFYDCNAVKLETRHSHNFRIPLMGISVQEADGINSLAVSGFFQPQYALTANNGIPFSHIGFEDFILELLVDQSFTWSFKKGQILILTPVVLNQACWKCKKPTLVIEDFYYLKETPPKDGQTFISFIDRLSIGEIPSDHLSNFNQQNLSRSSGIGQLKLHYDNALGDNVMRNSCVHCDAVQKIKKSSIAPPWNMKHSMAVLIQANDVQYGHWVRLD